MTAQSSTESTQDAYQDSRAQRTSPWPQDGRGLYNSTDSLDSNKAMSLALETAAAQRHASDSQSGPARTGDKAILASKAEDFLRGARASIGIQVASASALVPTDPQAPEGRRHQAGLCSCCKPIGAVGEQPPGPLRSPSHVRSATRRSPPTQHIVQGPLAT